MNLRFVFGAILPLMLAACGGGGGGLEVSDGIQAPPGSDPLPLAAGSTWDFDVVQSVGIGPATPQHVSVQATTTGMVDGWPTFAVAGGPLPQRLQRTSSEVRVVPADTDDALTRAVGSYALLQLPLKVGDRWTAVDKQVLVTDDSGQAPPVTWSVRIDVEVESTQVVQSTQGTYRDAFRVVTTWRYAPQGSANPGTGSRLDWIVPGIGVVRSTSSGYPVNGVRPFGLSYDLTAYRLR